MPNSKAIGVAFSDPALDGAVIGAAGGTVGFFGTTPVAEGAALTAQLTTISSTAPVTPDYAIQDLVNTSAFGFVTKDEGNTVLSVIKNLQDRVGQLESRLQAYGLLP
jgi:tryptophan synthase alpha subunit